LDYYRIKEKSTTNRWRHWLFMTIYCRRKREQSQQQEKCIITKKKRVITGFLCWLYF
jgi:hypothetical protein